MTGISRISRMWKCNRGRNSEGRGYYRTKRRRTFSTAKYAKYAKGEGKGHLHEETEETEAQRRQENPNRFKPRKGSMRKGKRKLTTDGSDFTDFTDAEIQ